MMHPPSCKPFSRETHESAFKRHHACNLCTTTVYLLRPPQHLSSKPPCILLSTSNDIVFRHPLTSKPLLTNPPLNFDIRKLNPATLAVSHYSPSFDKLLVVPASSTSSILFALYDGGQIRVHLLYFSEWVKLPGAGVKRELEEDKGLDSDSKDRKNGEVQSALKVSNIKDELEGMESDTDDSQDEEDGKMQCDINSQEKEDAEMHVNAPEPGTTDTQTPSLSATENEITRTLLSLNGRNNATEEGTLRENIRELVPRACTSSTLASQKSDSATAKFKGFDIRLDSVSTLEKIWRKHGNIVENSVMRNGDIIARALESVASMVRILDDNSAMSLSDSQAEYLVSTLSDLRCIGFNVNWLIPFVEKAEKIHKSKPLVEYVNNLSQLSSQAKERGAMLLDELTKLDVEENKRKEEMAKVSKMIPFCDQVKFDEPLGSGLT